MNVRKRSGVLEAVNPSLIDAKLSKFAVGLSLSIDVASLSADIQRGLYDGVTTAELDSLTAEQTASRAANHPDYGILAGRIAVDALRKSKRTAKSFTDALGVLYQNKDAQGKSAPIIAKKFYDWTRKPDVATTLNAMVVDERDYRFDYFGFKTLEKSYLLRNSFGEIIETPQFMYMRVAVQLHYPDFALIKETYDLLSEGYATHATPTLFNACMPKPQMASCFLLAMQSDSIDGIFGTLTQCANISKWAGGIGLSISNIRAKGSYIRGTGGQSNGIVPMLRVFDGTARYVDQGGNKRKGSFAVYLEPHHPDILDFLELKKNHGKEEQRARDLFYGLWISDLFMERVEADAQWSLFCPSVCPDLQDAIGDDYKAKYEAYEAQGLAHKVVRARDVWNAILVTQIETGACYMLYKDACNRKSNQKNLGTIRSSNLCTEIIQYSSATETATCNLASIALPKFLVNGVFDFAHLAEVTRKIVVNLNRVIDINAYPTIETKVSNFAHRPIGLGAQGLADVFAMLGIAFDSDAAKELNRRIFECIYCAAVKQSAELAHTHGSYSSYKGSPMSQGILQPDMWGIARTDATNEAAEYVAKYGQRNSLLVAPMPTASTSQILGNTECFEPFNSNIYSRRTLSGEFIVTNKHLVRDLERIGLWTTKIKNAIIADNGSIQKITAIPAHLREIYKTAFEIKQRDIIDMAADRGAYICQSQSMNLFVAEPTIAKLSSMHFHAWRKGLKTGMYYLRSKAAAEAIKVTLPANDSEPQVCSLDNPDCIACSS